MYVELKIFIYELRCTLICGYPYSSIDLCLSSPLPLLASPFVIVEPKNKMELITPAVEGTLRVLRAASKASTPPK